MPTPMQDQAIKWVEVKSRSHHGTRFHQLPPADFYAEVIDRIKDPEVINQNQTYTCGPAAMLYGLARKRPLQYAKFVCNLYAFGEAALNDYKIVAPDDVLAVRNTPDAMRDMCSADWVALASMRCAKNWVFSDIGTLRGGATFAGSLETWFTEAGFRDVANDTSFVSARGWDNWAEACRRCNNDGIVCVWMHTNMFDKSATFKAMFPQADCTNRSWYPDHWVGLHEVISVRNPVKVKLFSWGTTGTVKYPQADEDNFIRHYYGHVSADP
jgi:hypothetical protein